MKQKSFLSFLAHYQSYNVGLAILDMVSSTLHSEQFFPGPKFRCHHQALCVGQFLCLISYHSAYAFSLYCCSGSWQHAVVARQ